MTIKLYQTRILVSMDGYSTAQEDLIDLRDLVNHPNLLARVIMSSNGGTILITNGQWYNVSFPNKTHFTEVYAVDRGKVLDKLEKYDPYYQRRFLSKEEK